MDILVNAQQAALRDLETPQETRSVVYVFNVNTMNVRNIFKIGHTMDIARREGEHRSAAPDGRIAFYAHCHNAPTVESKLIQTLKLQYRMSREIVYDIPLDVVKQVILSLIAQENQTTLARPPSQPETTTTDVLHRFITEHYERSDSYKARLKRSSIHNSLACWLQHPAQKNLNISMADLRHHLKEAMVNKGFPLIEVMKRGKQTAKMMRISGEPGTHAAYAYIKHKQVGHDVSFQIVRVQFSEMQPRVKSKGIDHDYPHLIL